jgi:hypothetical protein
MVKLELGNYFLPHQQNPKATYLLHPVVEAMPIGGRKLYLRTI